MHLIIPAEVKRPEQLARQIVKDWPSKRLVARHKVRVAEVLARTDSELNPDCS